MVNKKLTMPKGGPQRSRRTERSRGASVQSLRLPGQLILVVRPRLTTVKPSSGNGRCNALASSHGARIQTLRSSSVVKITGIALG